MTDLVARLRACDCSVHCKSGCIQEKAADEIERLTAECEAWRECAQLNADRYTKAADEIERLRAALEIIAGRRQCLDNLMSNAEVARAALQELPRPFEARP